MANDDHPLFALLIPDCRPLITDPTGDAIIAMTCRVAARYWRNPPQRHVWHLLEAAAFHCHMKILNWLLFYYYTIEDQGERDPPGHRREDRSDIVAAASFRALHAGCWDAWKRLTVQDHDLWYGIEPARSVLLSRPIHVEDWGTDGHDLLGWICQCAIDADDADVFVHSWAWGSDNVRNLPPKCRAAYLDYNGPWHHDLHYHVYTRRWYPNTWITIAGLQTYQLLYI